jgi:membrane protease subunit (stomatin/prohibitin family)
MAGAWPILGLSAHSPDIEAAAMPAANEHLADYGLAIARFGNLDVNLDDDDNARLKKLAGDTAYSRLAGGFLQAAQAEALQGAGEGMAQGGAAASPMFLAAGLGMAGQIMQPLQGAPPPPPGTFAGGGQGYAQQAPPPAPAPADAAPSPAAAPPAAAPPAGTVACGNCQNQVRAGAKFCDSCGTPDGQALHQLQRRPDRLGEVLRRVRHTGQPAGRIAGTAGPPRSRPGSHHTVTLVTAVSGFSK